jgi:formamidopyrimidine-DNA glycosylase
VPFGDHVEVPELPEVETVRRRLAPVLEGRRIASAAILDHRLVAPEAPDAVAARLSGARIGVLDRRGKYLLVRLEDARALVVHLRMTGNLLLAAPDAPPRPHVRAVLELEDGVRVLYTDVRRFGTWNLLDDGQLETFLARRLGPEPLGDAFGGRALHLALAGRRAPVKALLLDQRVVAGVGNIYADEALHRARVHPQTPGAAVSREAAERLAAAVRHVLEEGIAAQGASIRDYRTPGGAPGSMQERFAVFGREGLACPSCGRPLAKIRVAGRGTHLCPRCQRRRSAARRAVARS